jgi:tight adherence protein B
VIPTLVVVATVASVLSLGAALSCELPRTLTGKVDEGRSDAIGKLRVTVSPRVIVFVGAALGSVAGFFLAGGPGLIGGGMSGAAVPIALERRGRTRGLARLEEQLLDAVTGIASSIRAGRSLVQSMEVTGEEVGAPLGTLLHEAADRVGLGVPMDTVLDDLANRVGGSDARLVTGVLRLQRRTGGAMAASLDRLARTLRSRRDGARELRSLTAQARLSAGILGLLPLGFFLFLSVIARRDVESAYRTAAGASAIGLGLVLQGAAFAWIRRLLRVEET